MTSKLLKVAFKRLVNLVPQRGLIVAFDGSENVTECIRKAFCRVQRYGFKPDSDWQIRNLRHVNGQTQWEVWHNGEFWSELDDAARRRT